ncbi:MAG: DUF4097 family beta strand repeat-containing protein [Armatimonadota bacterium]|nr:DUF4097 family beta strand repeat-containing protein [Armatimonadota bacterium]
MNEELRRILRMVSEGKLTPEQAQMLIEALMAKPGGERARRRGEDAFEEAMEQLRKAFQGVDWKRIQQEWRRISEEIREQTRRGWEEAQRAFRGMGRWDIDLRLGAVQDVEFDQTVDIPAGARLIVQNMLGDVRVQGQEGTSQMRVRAEGAIRAEGPEQAGREADVWAPVIEQRGEVVFVRLARAGRFASADVDITVPVGVAVEIQSTVGDVVVEGTHAAASVESATGDITVRESAGRIAAISASGDIHLQRCDAENIDLQTKSGDIECEECACSGLLGLVARTASGDMEIRRLRAQQVQLNSVSGEIRLSLVEPFHGEAQVQNISGDVLVDLPAGSACSVRVFAPDGNLYNHLPVEMQRNERGEWEGTLGTGTEIGRLSIRTINGDVTLRSV